MQKAGFLTTRLIFEKLQPKHFFVKVDIYESFPNDYPKRTFHVLISFSFRLKSLIGINMIMGICYQFHTCVVLYNINVVIWYLYI